MSTFSRLLNDGIVHAMDIYQIRKQNLIQLIGGQRKSACAERWEMNPAHLSQILSDKTRKNLGDDVARRIEELEGLPRGWLDLAQKRAQQLLLIDSTKEAEYAGPISVWDNETPLDEDEVELPYYDQVELAAGDGRIAVQEIPGRKLRFSLPALREAGVNPKKAICAKIRGNSMEPLIMDRSTIGIDQSATDVIDGEIYALEHEGMLRVKYLYRLPGGGLRLRSFNRAEHDDEEYSPKEMQSQGINIIGWVFWWSTLRTRGAFKR
ncbi:helix-turn-helix transcriptional regulator [Pseudomonas aeruginosa]|uniref:S24 family peptidase n=1 Tax=Pseudomonas aeruginosa TaxID=287 RepID=UPI002AC8CF44|nr:helix-turn-helix transcriptional regulator [Pseudomonas aeruginosa]